MKAIGNPAAPGGGGIFLTNVVANGFGQWFVNLTGGLTRWDVTFTALDAGGDSSEIEPTAPNVLAVDHPALTPRDWRGQSSLDLMTHNRIVSQPREKP